MFNYIPIAVFLIVIVTGFFTKKDIFSLFCEGVLDGLKTVLKIFPSVFTLLLCINMVKVSGFFDVITKYLGPLFNIINLPVLLLPIFILRPFSGSGALALYKTFISTYKPDSRLGRQASVMMGSSETTFYVLSVYLGSQNIKYDYKVIICALAADLAAFIFSILTVNIFL